MSPRANVAEAACAVLLSGILQSNRADSKKLFITDLLMIKYIQGDLEGLLSRRHLIQQSQP